jgi:hypothetical protein
MGAVAWGPWPSPHFPPTGSPVAVARPRLGRIEARTGSVREVLQKLRG